MSEVQDLSDNFHARWLEWHPLAATSYGIPGYDHLMPDASEAAGAAWRAFAAEVIDRADSIDRSGLSTEDSITLGCLLEAAGQEVRIIDSAASEFTVTPMPFGDIGYLFAVSARLVLTGPAAAADYLSRLQRCGDWIDQLADRLRQGAAKGRTPVAALAQQAIPWAEDLLESDAPAPLLAPQAPAGWDGAAEWEEQRRDLAAEVVKPALARWAATVRDLLAVSRPDDRAGLAHLPSGAEDYARAIRTHTTLEISADELHRIGLEQISILEKRAADLGSTVGLGSLDDVLTAIRDSAGQDPPEVAIADAVRAIRRAEAIAGQVFPDPLPPPCEVTPMPPAVASSGAAPHYTPPRLDGGRAGTFWFNTERPTAGTGWDLQAVAFHEAVPGHHLQLSRLQLLTELPALQRQRSITVFSEGWGLYAEELAGEMGLYTDARSELGAIAASLMRAARLVVDTGLHHYGWSRQQALEYFTTHVPMPPAFLANEIDRYLVMPGQALAYMTGKLEIMRQRDLARTRLGSAFTLPGFHAALLDRGSLPLPVVAESLSAWDPAA